MRFAICLVGFCACTAAGRPAETPDASGNTTEPAAAPGSWPGERTTYRKAVGGLGAGYLYQTHLMIGALADLLHKRSLTPAETEALMDTTLGMQQNVSEVLLEVRDAGLAPNDRSTVDQMLEVNRLLSEQALALKALSQDQTEPNVQQFAAARKTTWVRLKALLNIRTP